MEWPCLPRSSRKCPVQSLLCPPPHSNLCDLPLHISHRPLPRRHAPDANEPRSTVAKTRELWCRSCPSPSLHWSLEKRPLRPRQLASNPFFISRSSTLPPHSSPTLSHLLLPPLQPLSLPEHVPASLSQDVQRLENYKAKRAVRAAKHFENMERRKPGT